MAAADPALRPDEGERGLASWDPDDLRGLLLPAWDAFLALAESMDLDGPTRIPGRTAREVCVQAGSWTGSRSVPVLVAEALANLSDAGAEPGSFDQKGHDEALRAAWAAAPRDEVLAALRRARSETADYLAPDGHGELGAAPVRSPIGSLPLTTVVCGRVYDLAVHALDLGATEDPATPDAALLSAGLAAMTDTTGALAGRLRVDGHASAVTPEGGWTFSAQAGSWRTLELPVVPDGWPRLEGGSADLLDAAAGRRNVAPMLATRRIRVHHPAGLLAFAPLVEVPGLPGGPGLAGAVRNVQAVTALLRRLPGVRG